MPQIRHNWTLDNNDSIWKKFGLTPSNNIAAFDFDGTLARSNCGKRFMETESDWIFTFNDVGPQLQRLQNEGWTTVIFNNQLEKDERHTQLSKDRLDLFCNLTHITPFIYMAIRDDKNRKPAIGMFEEFFIDIYPGIKEPSAASFYCGDAAGPYARNVLYRWSYIDHMFAQSINLTFYVPDEIFAPNTPPPPLQPNTIVIMVAANEVCFGNYLNDIMMTEPTIKFALNIDEIEQKLQEHTAPGFAPILYYNQFENALSAHRNRIHDLDPTRNYRIYWFTLPIEPFIHNFHRERYTIDRYCRLLEPPGDNDIIKEIYIVN